MKIYSKNVRGRRPKCDCKISIVESKYKTFYVIMNNVLNSKYVSIGIDGDRLYFVNETDENVGFKVTKKCNRVVIMTNQKDLVLEAERFVGEYELHKDEIGYYVRKEG